MFFLKSAIAAVRPNSLQKSQCFCFAAVVEISHDFLVRSGRNGNKHNNKGAKHNSYYYPDFAFFSLMPPLSIVCSYLFLNVLSSPKQ